MGRTSFDLRQARLELELAALGNFNSEKHGYRKILQGLFLTDGFGTGCEVGSACMRHNTEPTRIIERVMRGGEIDVRKFAEGALSRIRLRAFVLRRAAPS